MLGRVRFDPTGYDEVCVCSVAYQAADHTADQERARIDACFTRSIYSKRRAKGYRCVSCNSAVHSSLLLRRRNLLALLLARAAKSNPLCPGDESRETRLTSSAMRVNNATGPASHPPFL